jgi:hypothetical protein
MGSTLTCTTTCIFRSKGFIFGCLQQHTTILDGFVHIKYLIQIEIIKQLRNEFDVLMSILLCMRARAYFLMLRSSLDDVRSSEMVLRSSVSGSA